MSGPAESAPGLRSGDAVLVADVGNTRIKLAVVSPPAGTGLPGVTQRHDLGARDVRVAAVEAWLRVAAPGPAVMLLASVHEAAAARLEGALAELSATRHRPLRQRRVKHDDLPLEIRVDEPHRVGIDRLAGAAAAARTKPAGVPAIVVDCGTATTVDLVSDAGVFLGGAILPGPALMARALAEGTSRLPEVAALEHDGPPPLPGRSTGAAIAAGIGWGIRGAVTALVAEARRVVGPQACIILTGGARGAVRDVLPGAVEMPDLVLAGIGMAAARACLR